MDSRPKKPDRPLSGIFPRRAQQAAHNNSATVNKTDMPILSGRQIFPETKKSEKKLFRRENSTPLSTITTAPFFRMSRASGDSGSGGKDRKLISATTVQGGDSSKFCLVRPNQKGKVAFKYFLFKTMMDTRDLSLKLQLCD